VSAARYSSYISVKLFFNNNNKKVARKNKQVEKKKNKKKWEEFGTWGELKHK
jgi:hypothetical protein